MVFHRPSTDVWRRFEDETFLGKGNFSEVYRARCISNNVIVALKRVYLSDFEDEKVRSDCVKETELLKKLDHINIIRCYESFVTPGQVLTIVLELANGDLGDVITNHKNDQLLIPEKMIWNYFVQLTRAINHMHGKRMLHRDIKPANVFLTKTGIVKVGDLGLSRLFSAKTNAALSVVGTPYYMAPERIQESSYAFTSDIWSLGCLLYELAALQSPFYADKKNYVSLCSKIAFCEYPPIPADIYSQQMRYVVKCCIAAAPEARPNSQDLLLVAEKMNAHYHGRPPINVVIEAAKRANKTR